MTPVLLYLNHRRLIRTKTNFLPETPNPQNALISGHRRRLQPQTAGNIPSSDLLTALHHALVRHLLVHDPDPSLLSSLQYTDISITIVDSGNLTAGSKIISGDNLSDYIASHVLPFHPRFHISALILGRDAEPDDVIPCITVLRSILSSSGLPQFPISTILSFSKALDPAFPPSAASFKPHLLPLLKALDSVGSPIYIYLFPFDLYRESRTLPIGFAMFEPGDFSYRVDPATQAEYRNLFDMMVDATFIALAKAGRRQMSVVVAGTGCPTGGAGGGKEATVGYAGRYNRGLVKHLRSGNGTPKRTDGVDEAYVHELFDEGDHKGLDWGVWYKNLSAKYDLDLSGSGGGHGRDATAVMLITAFFWVLLMTLAAA